MDNPKGSPRGSPTPTPLASGLSILFPSLPPSLTFAASMPQEKQSPQQEGSNREQHQQVALPGLVGQWEGLCGKRKRKKKKAACCSPQYGLPCPPSQWQGT